jgi:formate-dependent phosphoribosylglycinamide formyltransferase (GAR transformylase)
VSNKRNLIIIGAGIEQIEAYIQAKKLGLTVIGTDINPNAPAFQYSDYQIIASTRDVKSTVDSIIKFNESINIK